EKDKEAGGKGGKGGKGGGKGIKGGQPASPPKVGLNKVTWSTFLVGNAGGKGGGGFGGGKGGGFGGARGAPPGVYRVVLNVDGQEYTTTVRLEADPNVPRNGAADEQEPFLDFRKIN